MPDFDLFVIGGDLGGVACARRAASHGAKVGLTATGQLNRGNIEGCCMWAYSRDVPGRRQDGWDLR